MAIGLLIQFMAAAISHILCVVVLIPYQTSSCAVLTGNLLSLCQPKLIPTLYTISLCLNIVEQEMFLTLLSFDPHSCAASHLGKGQVHTIRSTPFSLHLHKLRQAAMSHVAVYLKSCIVCK
uniref:Uncharacterized protein n=1 Tax=Rhipicephalus zambeziensis TaxID=60191 RepID=A0A224YAI4_9ACAR